MRVPKSMREVVVVQWKSSVTLTTLLVSSTLACAQTVTGRDYTVIRAPDGSETALVLTAEQIEAGRRNQDSLAERGFVEMLDEPRRVDAVLARMEERRVAARSKGRPDDPDELGFMELTRSQYVEFSSLPLNPATLDQKYLLPESRSFVLMGNPIITQLHTGTQFGSLLIEEYPNTESSYVPPNLTIAGEPATFANIKYQDDAWASALYVQYGSSYFIVETDRKLEVDTLHEFSEMVENLVKESERKR